MIQRNCTLKENAVSTNKLLLDINPPTKEYRTPDIQECTIFSSPAGRLTFKLFSETRDYSLVLSSKS